MQKKKHPPSQVLSFVRKTEMVYIQHRHSHTNKHAQTCKHTHKRRVLQRENMNSCNLSK